MKFTPIDLQNWPRAEMFYYFSQTAPTGYSLTVNMDVTLLKKTLKENGLKFFPAYLWLVTKNLNRQPEFKIARREGQLGYYDSLTPLYAAFHNKTKTISLMWSEYSPSFPQFYKEYLENQKNFGENRGLLAQPQTPPPVNAYTVSCLPWVSFTHFAVHSYRESSYYFPSVEAGRFFEQENRLWMPLSLTCHHAASDGWHVKCFLEDLQKDINRFSDFL